MAEDFERLFADVREFGWDPKKRESNLRDKKIDFDDAKEVFDGDILVRRSDRHDEIRYPVFGYLQGRHVTIVCTLRGSVCWIISARRASRRERGRYYPRLPRRAPSEGQD